MNVQKFLNMPLAGALWEKLEVIIQVESSILTEESLQWYSRNVATEVDSFPTIQMYLICKWIKPCQLTRNKTHVLQGYRIHWEHQSYTNCSVSSRIIYAHIKVDHILPKWGVYWPGTWKSSAADSHCKFESQCKLFLKLVSLPSSRYK